VVCVDGTRIFVQVPNEPRSVQFAGDDELIAGSEDNVHLKVSEPETASSRCDSGEVDRMELVGHGEALEARKIP
jgi:hypothetical protein